MNIIAPGADVHVPYYVKRIDVKTGDLLIEPRSLCGAGGVGLKYHPRENVLAMPFRQRCDSVCRACAARVS